MPTDTTSWTRTFSDANGNEYVETVTEGSYSIKQTKFASGGLGLKPEEVPPIVAAQFGDRLLPTGGTAGQVASRDPFGALAWVTPSGGGGANTAQVTAYDGPSRKATVSYVNAEGITVTVADCPNASAYSLSVGDTVAIVLRSGTTPPLVTGRVAVSNTYTPPAYAPFNVTSGYPFDQTSVASTSQFNYEWLVDTGNVVGKGAGVIYGMTLGNNVVRWVDRANGTIGTLPAVGGGFYALRVHDGKLWVYWLGGVAYYDKATAAWVTPVLPAFPGTPATSGWYGGSRSIFQIRPSDGALILTRWYAPVSNAYVIVTEKWDIPTQAWVREWSSPQFTAFGAGSNFGTNSGEAHVVGDHYYVTATGTGSGEWGVFYHRRGSGAGWANRAQVPSANGSDLRNRFFEGEVTPNGTLWMLSRSADTWASNSRHWLTRIDTAGGATVSQWLPGVAVANGIQYISRDAYALTDTQVLFFGTARDAENDGTLAVIWSTDGATTAQVWTGAVTDRNLYPITLSSVEVLGFQKVEPGRYQFTVPGAGAPISYDVTL